MSLWIDKYRPKNLSKLDYHLEQAEDLKKIIKNGDFPHLLFYGPSGAGKKTRIMCLLREMYGVGVEKLRIEKHNFTTPSNKKIEIATLASNYHIEVTPSDAGFHDRFVIQELIKNVAQSHQLEASTQRHFKVVVITEVDQLSKDAQHALRRTMEKYMSTCRIILYCNVTSKVIPAIRSRCLAVRVAAPTHDEIAKILHSICQKEGLVLPPDLAMEISIASRRNLRRAILICETCRVKQYPFTANQNLMLPDWELYLCETANAIVSEQSSKRLLEVRQRIYELTTKCIPADVIMKGLYNELVHNCDGTLKTEVSQLAAFYEHRINLGQKPIYHLEAFIAKFMSIYKQFLEEGLDAMMF